MSGMNDTSQTPCFLPCPKCGNTDIYRRFFEKGQDTNPVCRPKRGVKSSDWVDRKDDWVQRAKKDCIVHHCRCCGWEWDGDSMAENATGKRMTMGRSGIGSALNRLVGACWRFLGGGTRKYRVRGCRIEMKGGGTGPFWGFAHFSDFDSPQQAERFARKWASENNGVYCINAGVSE